MHDLYARLNLAYRVIGPTLGGPVSLKMYGSDGPSGAFDAWGAHNSGMGISDAAGVIAPGAMAPGYHSFNAGGGLSLTADASRFFALNSNQHLTFGLTFDYHRNDTDFDASALAPGAASAASVRGDMYTVLGSVNYMVNSWYFQGAAAFDWSALDITNNLIAPGAQGDTDGHGYNVTAKVGNVFQLFNSTGAHFTTIGKASVKATSGYAVLLDVSGHYRYLDQRDNGFTDNTGFTYGVERLSYSDAGAEATLATIIPRGQYAWSPFVGVSVDRQFDFSHTFDIPAQTATAADTLLFTQSNAYWGVKGGVALLTRYSAQLGVQAFYDSSADTHIVGGNVFVKIPFYADAPPTDGGIKAAHK